MNARQMTLMTLALLTAASVVWTALRDVESEGAVVPTVAHQTAPKQLKSGATHITSRVLPLRPRATVNQADMAVSDAEDEMFRPTSWTPPPSLLPPLPPSLAEKPAGPFKYVGKMSTADGWTVFLAKDNETFVVKVGDTVAGEYKIESIALPVMTITNKPLHLVQTLQID